MLFQVGGQGTRPTFFEMALPSSSPPASVPPSLTLSAYWLLRRPFIHRILDYDDEFFALLMLVLKMHSLRTTDASFAESLYGLRRRAVNVKVQKNDAINHGTLEKRQKTLSVVFLVVLPYLKSKMQSAYNKEREAALQVSLWGQGD